MPEIRTRDEALAAVDAALAQWSGASADLLTRALTAAGAAQADAEAEVARRANQVTQLTGLLASLRGDDPLRSVVAAQLVRARESLAAGRRAAAALAGVAARAAALHRSQVRNTQAFAAAARADLTRRGGQLDAYRAAGGGPGAGIGPGLFGGIGSGGIGSGGMVSGGMVSGGTVSGGLARDTGSGPGGGSGYGPGARWLADRGLSDVDVGAVDCSDNPVTGKFGRGDLTRTDYRWAVTALDEVIRPGLEAGQTRDDFAALDAASGARELRRYADVYDWFFGDEKIRVDRWADGTVHVTNGRHRFEIARELGITRLPGEWGG